VATASEAEEEEATRSAATSRATQHIQETTTKEKSPQNKAS